MISVTYQEFVSPVISKESHCLGLCLPPNIMWFVSNTVGLSCMLIV